MSDERVFLTVEGEEPCIIVDRAKCIGCSMCSKVCTRKMFTYDNGGAIFMGPNRMCMKCTQCVAICPAEALKIKMPDGSIKGGEEIPLEKRTCDPETMLNQIKFRRSTRSFRNKKIESEKIEKLAETVDCAPKGNNRQVFRAVFVTEKVEEIRELFLKELKRVALALPEGSPLISAETVEERESKRMRMVNFYDIYVESNHRVDGLTFNAPMILVLIGNKNQGGRMLWDSGITCAYVEHMAVSLGLGATYLGMAMTAAENSETLREAFDLKDNEAFAGIMVLGYPEYVYKRTAPREKTDIKIV